MNSKSIISQFSGCFHNQTILIPSYNYLFQDSTIEYSFPSSGTVIHGDVFSNEYFYGIWMVMFWLSFFAMFSFGYRLLQIFWGSFNSKCSYDVVDDMRRMIEEISRLSFEQKQEMSEQYYILTNLLVNRFRIEVYEKILK